MTAATKTARWIEGYLSAWKSNDPDEIGDLFTEEAEYYTAPFRLAWRGRQAIVEGWLERPDEPGTWSFDYEVLAEQDSLGVVQGVTTYLVEGKTFSNLFLIWLDGEARCTKFVEYYMLQETPG